MNIRNEVEYVEIRVRTNGLPITYRMLRPVMRKLVVEREPVRLPPVEGFERWGAGASTMRLVIDAESACVERTTMFAKPLWRRVWEAIRG